MSIAFLSIVGLLFASGMISFFELSHLSYDTEEILKANQRNVELAKEMLGAVHDQTCDRASGDPARCELR